MIIMVKAFVVKGSSGEVIPDRYVTIGWSPMRSVTHIQTVDEEESSGVAMGSYSRNEFFEI